MGKALICGQAFNKKAKDSWSRNVNRKFIAAQPGACSRWPLLFDVKGVKRRAIEQSAKSIVRCRIRAEGEK